MTKITCFGEVLWDIFPEHKKIGGAPLNVAVRLKSMQNDISIISRIGLDDEGKTILNYIKEKGILTEGIQTDDELKTGEVKVLLNKKGSAKYSIEQPRAWDNIQFNNTAKTLVENTDAFIYGSLTSRSPKSRQTLLNLLEYAKYKIFDVNLRAPHYSVQVLLSLMKQANFIKFNDDELYEIASNLNSKTQSLEQNILFIAKETNTESICVTKGRHGAILYFNNKFYYNSGYRIQVLDTVGAGDSFLGSLIDGLLKKKDPQKTIDTACAIGAIVASSKGANPIIKQEVIDNMILPSL